MKEYCGEKTNFFPVDLIPCFLSIKLPEKDFQKHLLLLVRGGEDDNEGEI